MDIQAITQYFLEYGSIIVFIIVFLEYLNLPGFPAGVIMPLTGIWASNGEIGLFTTIILTTLAGLCGSWLLYGIGYFSGDFIIKKYLSKFPKHEPTINRVIKRIHEKGCPGILVSKLIPVIRTVVSIPAGAVKMNFFGYSLYSLLGILIWNTALISAGYFCGEILLTRW